MAAAHTAFWDDLATDLRDPEFRRAYVLQAVRIATIDRIVADLDAARVAVGCTKADIARTVDTDPAAIRRLFSASDVNPTLGTLSEIAGVLGLRVTLSPLPADARAALDASLLDDGDPDVAALAGLVEALSGRTSSTARV